jgi:hypothetical protein
LASFGRKPLLIIIAVLVIVMVASLSYSPVVDMFGGTGVTRLVAVAGADKEIAYMGDNISFNSSHSTDDIKNSTWNFSDDNFSSVPNPMHAFEFPGWYNVTPTVADKGGKTDLCQLVIGVQRTNDTNERQGGRLYDIRPRWGTFTWWSLILGPNIHNPSVDVEVNIENGIGQFWVEIYSQVRFDDGSMPDETIYMDRFTLAHENYRRNRTILPDEMSCDMTNHTAGIVVVAGIDQGTWSGTEGRMASSFPLGDIEVKSK